MGAAILHGKLGQMPKGSHGSTFGGNPLVCAAANGALRYMVEQDLAGRSRELGDRFLQGLRKIDSPQIREVRGLGLMVGVELKTRTVPYLTALLERGIAAIPTGTTVIRFLPPLVVNEEEIDRTVRIFSEVMDG